MITLVNFADEKFASKQKINNITGKIFGKVDKTVSFNNHDLDTNILSKNSDLIEKYTKGYGNYFWKTYIIKKALKDVNEGDFLFYSDSGSIVIKSLLP